MKKFLILSLLVLMGAGCSSGVVNETNVENNVPAGTTGLYSVVRVVDGDTIVVSIDGEEETIRIIGIDTPEVKSSFTDEECFSAESSAMAKELLRGQRVSLERDITQDNRDVYDRLLRYMFLEDGTDFGGAMIEQGFGYEFTFRSAYRKQILYRVAESSAEKASLGLWGECD